MTATRFPVTSTSSRSVSSAPVQAEPRQHWLDQAARLGSQAADSAREGDLAQSARLILEALDCERRAGGVGPQVLQLIKPRN
ncbi:MAG: hypothetical protein WCQ20_14520 [Synechococcaceae cyanobacterium ELA739]